MEATKEMNVEQTATGNTTSINALIKAMADKKEDERRSFFEFTLLPQFKAVSPLERDQLISRVCDILKSSGVTKATVRKMVNDEVRPIKRVKSAGKVVALPPSTKSYNRSDVGNAQRFVDVHGERFRYCHKLKAWYFFDGKRWLVDSCGLAQKSIHALSLTMQAEAANIMTQDEKVQAFRWAVGLESVNRIESCLKAAQSYVSVEPTDFDRDPWLLNCENGTVDLKTGELRQHDREDMISKLCPVIYDPNAEAPLWLAFLNKIFAGDTALISYLQKKVGYSLTGVHREKEFYLLHGVGDNGKSVFVETNQGILGDYASTISPDRLTMTKEESGATPELARLVGVRFVSSQETERGKSLREGFIKAVTGGDTLTARHLYAQPFDFRPAFKLWFSTNFKPEIKAGGEAMWRRVKLIPFKVTIPPGEQDRELPEKLKAEWPGILAWAVRGCLEWHKAGHVEMPEAMKDAVESYKQEMDSFTQFLDACCEIKPMAQVTNKKFRAIYDRWCLTNGERPLRQNEFSGRLVERGLNNEKTRDGYIWRGIGISDE